MKHFRSVKLVVPGILLLAGCTTTASAPPDNSRDIAEMKERILELQEKAAVAEVEIARLHQEIRHLESSGSAGESAGASAPAAAAAAAAVTPTPAPEAAGVAAAGAGIVEESDLDLPQSAASTPPAGVTTTETAVSDQQSASSMELQPVDPAAQALYDRGYTLYHQGRYLDAESSFQRFLQANPMTELSDNAQFWIGECRYARGDIRGALAAFREAQQRYPEGNKIPDALIKEGDCLANLGDKDGARERYSEVQRRFPETAAAVMAQERLGTLD